MQRLVLLSVWLASSFVLLSQPGLIAGHEIPPQKPFPDEKEAANDQYNQRIFFEQQSTLKFNKDSNEKPGVKIEKKQNDTFAVTFEVNMTNAVAEGGVNFEPNIHSVYITGTFSDWIQPGTNSDYQLNPVPKSPDNNKPGDNNKEDPAMYTITLDLISGEHMYKYFLIENTPDWAMGEWAGEPNRSVFIDSSVILTDVWGSLNTFFDGGTGVEWDPFLVATAQQLHDIRMFPDAAYRQIADIDLAEGDWDEGDGWLPIGNPESPFKGIFDGNGFFIDNLFINRPLDDYAGLFGKIENSRLINIKLRNGQITAFSRVGTLCGSSYESAITDCSAEGVVTANGNWVGGLVGVIVSNTLVYGSYAVVQTNVTGYSAGGLVGTNEKNSHISNSYATGNVSGLRNVGGLLGYISGNGSVEFCYSTGIVSGDLYTGGLLGRQNGTHYVGLCFWNIETSSQGSSAGGVGLTTAQMMQSSSFEMWNFENTWNIDAGSTFPFLRHQILPGEFNFPPPFLAPSGLQATGTDKTISISWQSPSVATPTGYLIFRDGENIANAGPEATSYTDTGRENYQFHTYHLIAQYNEHESPPSAMVLAFAHTGFAGGNGSSENPYLVSTPGQLFTVRHFPESSFRQINDIDLAGSAWDQGEGWLPISAYLEIFHGIYDGNGHVITNLFINREINKYQGLFSSSGGIIVNLGVVDASITSPLGMAGLLVGMNTGQVENCYTTGQIFCSGTFGRIGGLAGWNSGYIMDSWSSAIVNSNGLVNGGLTGANSSGMILRSFASGNVSGESSTGGLSGINQSAAIFHSYSNSHVMVSGTYSGGISGTNSGTSMIADSYSTGSVEGSINVGGVSGYLSTDSYLWNCYAAGTVSGIDSTGGLTPVNMGMENVTGCFWDAYTTGQQTSAGGTSKNTREMVMQATFTNWDFDEIWKITEGQSYPYLWWQAEPGAHNFPTFIPDFYYLSLVANPPIGGSVAGAGSYAQDQVVGISAVCNPGYRFAGWTGHTTFVDHPGHEICNVTMPAENIVLTANFEFGTGISESVVADIAVYPNPATQRLWIEFNNTSGGPVMVQVSNISGQIAEQKEFARQGKVSLGINVSSYQSGLYVVKIQTRSNILIRKFLISN